MIDSTRGLFACFAIVALAVIVLPRTVEASCYYNSCGYAYSSGHSFGYSSVVVAPAQPFIVQEVIEVPVPYTTYIVEDVVVEPAPVIVQNVPARRYVAYRGRPAPYSRAWYDYCTRKYRSFNPATGTFQPYHGRRRLCR